MSPKIVATVDDLTFEFRKESIILMECKGPSVYAIEREPRKNKRDCRRAADGVHTY